MMANIILPIIVLAANKSVFIEINFYIYILSLFVTLYISAFISMKVGYKEAIPIDYLIMNKSIDTKLNIFNLRKYINILQKHEHLRVHIPGKYVVCICILYSLTILIKVLISTLSQDSLILGLTIYTIIICIIPSILCKNLFSQLKVSHNYFEKHQKNLLIPDA